MGKSDLGSVDYTLTYSQGETGNGQVELTLSGKVFQLMTGGRFESSFPVFDAVVDMPLEPTT